MACGGVGIPLGNIPAGFAIGTKSNDAEYPRRRALWLTRMLII